MSNIQRLIGYPLPQRTVGCYFEADGEESIGVLEAPQLARVALGASGDLELSAIVLIEHYSTYTQMELRVVVNGMWKRQFSKIFQKQ